MSHHPERTARNVRPVNQPPSYKNVPTSLVPKVKKLIENGRRYRKLEAEYARLMTEESLAALKKTEDEN